MSIRTGERGSVSVEMAILAPVFVLLIIAAIVFGRTAIAANALDVAAHDAARAAHQPHPGGCADNARAAAQTALPTRGWTAWKSRPSCRTSADSPAAQS